MAICRDGGVEAFECDGEECTIECRKIGSWQQPNSWKVQRPLKGDTYLTVSYSRLRNRYTLMDYQLVVSSKGMERVLHLASEIGASEGYDAREDISLWRVFEEDAWLNADGYALQRDCRPFSLAMVWNLTIEKEVVTVRWDAELLPGGSEGLLEGMGRRIDMRERSEVVLLRGEYTVTLAMPELMDVQYALEPGWNLLSCNLLLEKAYHLLLMDMGAICYDRETRCYVRWMENTQENCFWLFAREASVLTLQGWPFPYVFDDVQGWSLVSVEEATTLPEEWPAWEYVEGKYSATSELQPGKAYWFYLP